MGVEQITKTLFLLIFLPWITTTIAQETTASQVEFRCNANTIPPSTRFRSYLGNAVVVLQSATHSVPFKFYPAISGWTPIVYLSYLCQGDVNSTLCFDCVSLATETAIRNCSKLSREAVVYGEVCTFRYSDQSFYGHFDDKSPPFYDPLYETLAPDSVNVTRFRAVLEQVKKGIWAKLESTGNYGAKFATEAANVTESTKVYAMGECTWDLNPVDCKFCVHECASRVPLGVVGGRVMLPSCNFRFETYRFYNDGPRVGDAYATPVVANASRPSPGRGQMPAPPPNLTPLTSSKGYQPGGRKTIPPKRTRPSHVEDIAGFGTTLAVILLVISGALFCTYRRKKAMQASPDMDEITSADSLQIEFSKIRTATHNFAVDKKLGQGGFGEVYKGKLENGQAIAVKRLSRDSKQGIAEFKTEILLVANLQHRNLVKLLGFCFSGKEKILVYEYLSNSSLDRLLFDPIKREALNWEMRFRIISGIAKGLLYLHEDSRLKIIHRDLKTSNILLDDFMNPKISDFGMAKLFGVDQTQDATKTIVGTYGYMAPEYMLTGQYSVKSDIYSFGIIVLEMITGLRNNYMSRPLLEEALLHRAWRLWNEGSALELVDYVLGGVYSREEVIKCIHIGLLCIQEDASRRPKMTWVVAAIRDETTHFPAPTPPNFFNSIQRSASGSCSSTDPVASSSTGRETLTDLHGR